MLKLRRSCPAPIVRFQRVCYYCLDYLNAEGYRRLQIRGPGELVVVPANQRCDYCELRESGKLWVRPNWWKAEG